MWVTDLQLEMAPDEPPQRLKPEGHPTRDELVKSVRTPSNTKKQKGPTATSTPLDKDRLGAVEAQIIPAGVCSYLQITGFVSFCHNNLH